MPGTVECLCGKRLPSWKKFERLLPDIYECLVKIGDAMNTPEEESVIQEVYPVIPKISIDYGIMERSSDVLVLSGDFRLERCGQLGYDEGHL